MWAAHPEPHSRPLRPTVVASNFHYIQKTLVVCPKTDNHRQCVQNFRVSKFTGPGDHTSHSMLAVPSLTASHVLRSLEEGHGHPRNPV